jgi:hypothetical protein
MDRTETACSAVSIPFTFFRKNRYSRHHDVRGSATGGFSSTSSAGGALSAGGSGGLTAWLGRGRSFRVCFQITPTGIPHVVRRAVPQPAEQKLKSPRLLAK